MTRAVKYPVNVVNTSTAKPFRAMEQNNNICNDSSNVGRWGNPTAGSKYANAIAGKNGDRNHPATIQCTFNNNIPENAHVTGIIVQYAYRKRSYSSSTAHGSFGNPIISIPTLGLKGTGNAPPRNNFTEYNAYFGNLDLRGKDINSNAFTILFDLPQNTSTNPCWIEMQYFRIYIDYDLPNYVPSIGLSKSEVLVDELFTMTCRINETNAVMASESVNAHIEIPSGFSIIEAPANFNKNTGIWNPLTRDFNASAEFKLKLTNNNSYGDFKFKITEQMTDNHSQEANIFVAKRLVEVVDFSLTKHELEISDSSRNYTSLEIQVKNPSREKIELELDFGGLNIEGSPPGLNKNTGVLTVNSYNNEDVFDIQILLYSSVAGEYGVSMISDSFVGVFSDKVKVYLPSNLEPYYTCFDMDKFALDNLKDGVTYIFGCLGRITNTTTNILKGSTNIDNLQASVLMRNNSESDEIFTNQISQAGDWELLTCEFTYDSNKQLMCYFYGNFTTYNFGEVEFGNLFIIRKDKFSGYEYPALAFDDTELLRNNGLYANMMLEPPENNISAKHYFSIWDYMGLTNNQSLILHGLQIDGDVSTDGDINLILGVGHSKLNELDYHLDSINLDENSTNFNIGGKFKTFGINFNDLLDILSDLRFYLQIDDVYDNNTPLQVSMRNLRLTVYYSMNGNPCDFKINGVSSNHYCIELNAESEIPRGVNYDATTIAVDGADGEFANTVNIRNKKLKLKFNAYGDDFIDSTELLKYVTEFLYPKRDKLDKPLLNNISFFFDESNCYDYYIEDAIDCEAMVGGYDCEVDLIIPSGLARTVTQVEKSFAGDIGHIGKIKPEIIFLKQINNTSINQIQLIEQETSQILKLEGAFIDRLPNGTLMKLDCKNRKVYYHLKNEWILIDVNNITLDSNFFVLTGYFNFENSINCKIREVNYHELSG